MQKAIPKTKKNYRLTKKWAWMTKAGVKPYRKANPWSRLQTAVTWKVKSWQEKDGNVTKTCKNTYKIEKYYILFFIFILLLYLIYLEYPPSWIEYVYLKIQDML